MRFPLFLIASIALTCTTAFAQDLSDATGKTKVSIPAATATAPTTSAAGNAYAQELYSSGETTHNFGRVLSWGGLALNVLGGATNNPTLSSVGVLSFLVGIPVNGAGASDMVEAANVLNPAAAVEMNGWGTYSASWALQGAGIALLFGAVTNDNENMVVPAVVCMIGGGVLQYVAWYQFSSSADHATLAKNTVAYSIDVAPALYASRKSGVLPGAQIALRF